MRTVYEDEAWMHTVMDLCTGPDLLDWVRLRQSVPIPESVAASSWRSLPRRSRDAIAPRWSTAT